MLGVADSFLIDISKEPALVVDMILLEVISVMSVELLTKLLN
jgi:hypothetical protein